MGEMLERFRQRLLLERGADRRHLPSTRNARREARHVLEIFKFSCVSRVWLRVTA